MLTNELKQLLDDAFIQHRNRIRYNGTGPRLHGLPNKIWPRDSVDYKDETRKILLSLSGFNVPPSIEAKIKEVIKYIFEGLRLCNIDNLFRKCCPLGPRYFNDITFEIKHALDAYTTYNQVLDLIHSVIRSIDGINKRRPGSDNYVHTIFGSNINFDIFKRNLKCTVASSVQLSEIHVDDFLFCGEKKSIDLDQIRWLDGLEPKVKYKVYIQVLFALLKFIFELLRRYFYITLSNPYFDKLFYFRYDLWQKISNKATKNLIKKNILKELELNPEVMNSLNHFASSKLKYHLKKDDVRPICTSQRDSKTNHLNRKFEVILNHVLHETANYRKFTLAHLLEGLRYFKERQEQGQKVYIVRADIKDCFPSVNQNLLVNIIANRLSNEAGNGGCVKLYKLDCARLKDNKRITQYCVDIEEFERKNPLLSVDSHKDVSLTLDEFIKEYLRPCVISPVLRESKFSRRGYLLQQGLRQGSTFSPILSSIYIQTAFNEEGLVEFLSSTSCKVYRYVDDILFISTDLEQAKLFMHKMLRGFKTYNVTMNLEKLACNFTCRGLDSRLCRLIDHVIFYRQQICLKPLTCKYNFDHRFIQLPYSFKLHPYLNKSEIVKSIKRSRWNYIHLDSALNGIDLVISNIFERSLLLAHRAATMVILSFQFRNTQDEELVKHLLRSTAGKVWKVICRGVETNVIDNGLSRQQVVLIVAAAYEATWTRRKLSHRALERKRLTSFRKRATMKYLTTTPTCDDSSIVPLLEFENRIKKLIKEFPKSHFAQEVLIPDKDGRF